MPSQRQDLAHNRGAWDYAQRSLGRTSPQPLPPPGGGPWRTELRPNDPITLCASSDRLAWHWLLSGWRLGVGTPHTPDIRPSSSNGTKNNAKEIRLHAG